MNTKIFYLFAFLMCIVCAITYSDGNYYLSHMSMLAIGFDLAIAIGGEFE